MLFKKETTTPASRVIIDEQVVSLADLKRNASRANTRFWSLTLGVALISSMMLPYMSIAATIPSGTSEAFSGEVAPGYSMGGVKVTAYGIDLNSWGRISRDRVVGSTYGIWSGERLRIAGGNLTSKDANGKQVVRLLEETQSNNYNLKGGEKAQGWQMITGRSSYSLDNPDGYEASSQSSQTDTVAPYRTTSDYNFWDNCLPTSNGNASASIEVSLFADFIIVAVDKESGCARVLESPDEVEASSSGAVGRLYNSEDVDTSSAIPCYVPLSILFDRYGLTDPKEATITNLLNAIATQDRYGDTLGDIATENSLVGIGTHYSAVNADDGKKEESDAFNPYPYTMVFSKKTDNGTVVSSLYNNSEAYVYFSPASAYSQYMQLRTEYEEIKAASTSEIKDFDAVKTVQLGYYLAEMAILEAYLDEALPQDMTRGYVGPSEPSNIADSNLPETTNPDEATIAGNGNIKENKFSAESAESFRGTSYATIMYDVVRYLGEGADGSEYKLGETNAIMDTLSVFGYNSKTGIKTGVMKGLPQDELAARFTMFTPYRASKIETLTSVEKAREKAKDEESSSSSSASGSSSAASGEGTAGSAAETARAIAEGASNLVTSAVSSLFPASTSTAYGSPAARAKWFNAHKKQMTETKINGSITAYQVVPTEYTFVPIGNSECKLFKSNNGVYSAASAEETAKAMQNLAIGRGWSAGLSIDKTTVSIPSAAADDVIETTTVEIPKASAKKSIWDFFTELMLGSTKAAVSAVSGDGSTENKPAKISHDAGLYIPPYYPIQQHKMPASEKVYRFQIISAVPYSVVIDYIKSMGFSEGVTLMYSSNNKNGLGIDSFTNISDAQDRRAALAASYEMAEKSELAQGLTLSSIEIDKESAKNSSLADGVKKDDEGKETGTESGRTVANTMISLYGGTGFSSDDLSYTLDEKDDKTKLKTVTAARVDSALIGYAASSMTADNVHDLFDVVRCTRGLKNETYLRFYNPIKSEGGDTDFFVTRVSPALTTYLPAILVNGYTAAGGTAIQPALTTVNCSFDYFSTPSFAPCFASHTSDDCYYGVLNYELRAFYSSGFIKTLSETAGIPSVQAYMDLTEQMEAMNSEAAAENQVMWTDVATLYIMAKRLAYINAVIDVTNGKFQASYRELRNMVGTPKSNGSEPDDWINVTVKSDRVWLSEIEDKDKDKRIGGHGDDGAGKGWEARDVCWNENPTLFFDNSEGRVYQIKKPAEVKFTGGIFQTGGYALDSGTDAKNNFKWDKVGKLAKDQGANPFDNGLWYNGLDCWDSTSVYDDQGRRFELPAAVMFSYVYGNHLNSLIGKGGKYYWEPPETIREKLKNKEIVVSVDSEAGGKYDEDHEYLMYSVYFNYGTGSWLASKSVADGDVIQAYQEKIKEAAAEITNAVINMAKDMKLLQSAMPSQMQNCLAWADYQNSSDSEGQFEADPSKTNVTINVDADEGSDIDTEKIQSNGVLNRQSLGQYGYELVESEDGGDAIGNLKLNNGTNVNNELQSKMERGVEGSTWTSTTQPAEYTMSATIARVDSMANETGTTYPYSGLASGRLMSGTDQYAVMQSHVIDYTSIASGIAGDLATRQRAKVVSITNPEYSSITDFLNILGNIGAFFGELGKSMLNAASGAFSDMYFTTTGSSAKTNAETAAVQTTSSQTKSKAASMVYTSAGGINMNRLPASASVFNYDTGQLAQKPVVSSGSPTAGAAGVGMVRSFGFLMLTGASGLYTLLQTFGLTLVMVFIGFIAFRNFYAYALANDTAMIQAQMQLKIVLPRSILAIFMIGLPPLGAGSMGFEGGNFILLSLITNVMNFIGEIFFSLNGTAIMSVFDIDLVSSFGANIFAYLFFFLCCVVLSLCFLIGIVCLIIQVFLLFGFYLVGPIVWAFYVWPYSASSDDNGKYTVNEKAGGFITTVTQKLNFGLFTAHRAGNIAPMGLLFNYTVIAGLTVAWSLIFWFISMIFLSTSGVVVDTGTSAAGAAELATGFPQATAALFGSEATDPIGGVFGVTGSHAAGLRMLLSTIIAVCAFVIMGRLLMKTFTDTLQFQKTIAGRVGNAIKQGISSPEGLASMAGKAANVLAKHGDKLPGAAGQFAKKIGQAAGGLDMSGKDGKGLAAKNPLAAQQKAKREELKKKLAAEGKSDAYIEKKLREQKKADKKELQAAKDAEKAKRPALADRLGDKLKELSTVEGAERALAKKNALGSAFDLAANGHPLSAIGQALGVNKAIGRQQQQAELETKSNILKDARDAADELRHLEGAERDEKIKSLNPNVAQELKRRGVLSSSGKYMGDDAAKDAMKALDAESTALDRDLAWSRTAENITKQMTNSLNRGGNGVSKALLSAAPSGQELADRALNEASIRNVLEAQGLADTPENRAAAQRAVLAAADDYDGAGAISSGFRRAQTPASQASLAKAATVDVLDRAEEIGGTEQEKLQFVRSKLGEACDNDEYVRRRARLDAGEMLTETELTEMASFEAQMKLTGKSLPPAALKAYSTGTAQASAVLRADETYAALGAPDCQDNVAMLGAFDKSHYDSEGHIISMPAVTIPADLSQNAENVAMMKNVLTTSMDQAGISGATVTASRLQVVKTDKDGNVVRDADGKLEWESMSADFDAATLFQDTLFGNKKTMGDVAAGLQGMINDPKQVTQAMASTLAQQMWESSPVAEEYAQKQAEIAEGIEIAMANGLTEADARLKYRKQSDQLANDLAHVQAKYKRSAKQIVESLSREVDVNDMLNAAAVSVVAAERKVVVEAEAQKVAAARQYCDIVGSTKEAGDAYESKLFEGLDMIARSGLHALFAKANATTATEKHALLDRIKNGEIVDSILDTLDTFDIQRVLMSSDRTFADLVADDAVFESARPIFRGNGIFDAESNRETMIKGKVYEDSAKAVAVATGDRSVADLVTGDNVGNAVILTQALEEYASQGGTAAFEFNPDYRAPLMVYMAETRTSGRDLDSIIDFHADADYSNLCRDFQGVSLPDDHRDVDAICGAIYDIINDDGVPNLTNLDEFAELVQSSPAAFKSVVAQRIDLKALGDDESFDQVVAAFSAQGEGQNGRQVMDNMMNYYEQFHNIRGAADELGLSDTLAQLSNDQVDHAARAQARVDATKPKSKPVQGTKSKQGKRSQGAGSAYSHGSSGAKQRSRQKR